PGAFQYYNSTGRDGAPRSNRLAHTLQNHVGNVRLGADGGRIPDESAVFLRWIAPRRLAGGNPLLDDPLRLAEQNRNVLLRVQTVADEKRDDNHVPRLHERVTIINARAFFEKNRVDVGANFRGA